MGYRQMRNPSFDIDIIAPTENSISSLYKIAQEKKYPFMYNPDHRYFYMIADGNPISISPGKIYNIEIFPKDIINYTDFNFVKPELLTCLKLRRRQDGKHRHKDIIDIASLILSHHF